MRAPVITMGFLLPMLGAYVVSTQLQGSADKAMEGTSVQAVTPISYDRQALAGSWAGVSRHDVPIRLFVKDVHPEWAQVLLAWGKNAEGPNPRGSLWTRAKILPDGQLCISYPVHLILTLSEDTHALVGTTVHADPLASVLLTRVGEEQALTAFSR
jgi:hypothetical protein